MGYRTNTWQNGVKGRHRKFPSDIYVTAKSQLKEKSFVKQCLVKTSI